MAKDKEGLIGGVFRTQKDAVRFALFEVAGNSACVRVVPRTGPDPSGTIWPRTNDGVFAFFMRRASVPARKLIG